ncbi:pre-mRNA-processing factor 39 [Lepidopterella palustris CBS 459.81]|uniref:Pre-mRNA-processing factor 39 n=1 Tax=Lepidopterella palustris CBS 459.81 TaxID=1314670 RepID=A0A8E2J8T2_9PEZI|nr:pre-mRNA-processing factor 39 [Lepidopterella palustris CBS 459.81]
MSVHGSLAEINYGGSEEENAELRKLTVEVAENEDDAEAWEKIVRAAEGLEGGLNRNSSAYAIAFTRDIYDRFLAKFPLFFGYWKKYADLEFSIAGTEAAEMVYERGVASITNSVDLWTNYCSFKVETSHDPDVIRELFERGAHCVGLDFLAHLFWDKYLEFEERLEAQDKIFAILDRVIHIPMHQYARYFERFRQLAQTRPVAELLPADILSQFQAEIAMENPGKPKNELEIEREVRVRIDNFHLEIFHRTQNETTKRWTYEQEIKRPYFHVNELDEAQLINWRKYLDFEEVEGDYQRITFLYERCLVTAAYYDEFWLRYARWMLAQDGKQEEVRMIYQRASCFYVPISRPAVRLQYAIFEEMQGRVDVARAIHEAMLFIIPGHIETIVSWANLERRHAGLEAAIAIYQAQIDSKSCSIYCQGALVAEWAKLLWKVKGSVEEARQVYQKNQHWYLDVRSFWVNYLMFEMDQPTSAETEKEAHARIKQVADFIRTKSRLSPQLVKDLTHYYMAYLLDRCTEDAAKEYMTLDKEVNGPFSVQSQFKAKIAEDGKESTTQRRLVLENGHPGVEVNEAAVRRGENIYNKYYQQQGEQPSNGHPTPLRFS